MIPCFNFRSTIACKNPFRPKCAKVVNSQYNFKRAHDRGLNFINTLLKSWSCFRPQANTLVAPSLTKCQGRDWCQIISGSFIPDYLDIIPADKLSQFRHGRARSGHYLPYCFLEQKLMKAGMDDVQSAGREFRRTTKQQLPRSRTQGLRPGTNSS